MITVVENEHGLPQAAFRTRADAEKFASTSRVKDAPLMRELDTDAFPFYILLFDPSLGSNKIIYSRTAKNSHIIGLIEAIKSKSKVPLDMSGRLHVFRVERPFVYATPIGHFEKLTC